VCRGSGVPSAPCFPRRCWTRQRPHPRPRPPLLVRLPCHRHHTRSRLLPRLRTRTSPSPTANGREGCEAKRTQRGAVHIPPHAGVPLPQRGPTPSGTSNDPDSCDMRAAPVSAAQQPSPPPPLPQGAATILRGHSYYDRRRAPQMPVLAVLFLCIDCLPFSRQWRRWADTEVCACVCPSTVLCMRDLYPLRPREWWGRCECAVANCASLHAVEPTCPRGARAQGCGRVETCTMQPSTRHHYSNRRLRQLRWLAAPAAGGGGGGGGS
jgi:hypothetical protein